MTKRTQALSEEDLLTRLAEEVHHVIQTYVEGYAGIELVTSSPEELRSRVTDFVMGTVEVKETDAQRYLQALKDAIRNFRRTNSRGEGSSAGRQYAVAIVNAAYNYIVQTNPDWNDDTIDSEVDALIAEHDIDPGLVNEVVNSIY